MPRIAHGSIARGRWSLPVAALFVALLAVGPTRVSAQRVAPELPRVNTVPVPQLPSGNSAIGGTGLSPSIPELPSAPSIEPLPAPLAPAAAAPVAAPGSPARIIRFRCEVAPGDSTCKEQPPPDGGGDDDCDCARDLCYNDGAGARICEKP